MIQAMIAKKVIEVVIKKIATKHKLNKLQKYVEQDNELDIQMKQVKKNLNKYGKYIEELEKDNAILKVEVEKLRKDSHPPIKNLERRLKKLEKKEK